MRRREILVFVAAFAVVLLGGAALAQVGTFASSPDSDAATLSAAATDEKPAETVAPAIEEDTKPTTNPVDVVSEKLPEQDEKEPADPPKDEEPPADPPKDEEPPADDDTTPPPLAILFPENEQHFDEKLVAFEGETEPGARVLAGRYEADVDKEGNWRIVLILNPGSNVVTFKAKDAAGNMTEKSIKVFLDAEEPTEKEFSAHQKWEVVDGHPAENKYYGTGTPGTTVWVGSEYGDGSVKIGENGEWKLYVKFTDAPCNKTFTVVVENETNRREFRMKYACASHEFSATQKYGENTDPWTKFYGTGNPGDTIWVGSEFGTVETVVESNGEWLAKLHFNDNLPANKEIGIVIESSSGDRATFGFYWIVKDHEEVEFTANQKYGSCGEAVPYDKFWGTAAPGVTIWVESPYGGGTTTADSAGKWQITVEFPEAPVGEAFTVVIESSDDGRATFSFIRTGEDH
ncbi:MAG: hypothetical protein GY788_10900 [bacterium]|nr:hypothetical protein [bacterium]